MTTGSISGISFLQEEMNARVQVVIKNRLGLHARPASRLAQLASTFQSAIWIERNGKSVDGKSILEVLTLACPQGAALTLRAEGPDSAEAVEALRRLVENKFGGID